MEWEGLENFSKLREEACMEKRKIRHGGFKLGEWSIFFMFPQPTVLELGKTSMIRVEMLLNVYLDVETVLAIRNQVRWFVFHLTNQTGPHNS